MRRKQTEEGGNPFVRDSSAESIAVYKILDLVIVNKLVGVVYPAHPSRTNQRKHNAHGHTQSPSVEHQATNPKPAYRYEYQHTKPLDSWNSQPQQDTSQNGNNGDAGNPGRGSSR